MQEEYCKHLNTEYQPYERDTNTQEYLLCEDCDKELDLEFDYMLYSKEEMENDC